MEALERAAGPTVRSSSRSAYATRVSHLGSASGMDIRKMRHEQGYATATSSGDICVHVADPVYLNCRASEPQASLHAQPCVTYDILVCLLICLK